MKDLKQELLKQTRNYIEKHKIDASFHKNSQNFDIDKYIQQVEYTNLSTNSLPVIYSKKRGITAKFLNRIITKIYYIIANSVSPALNNQKNINQMLLTLIKKQQEESIEKNNLIQQAALKIREQEEYYNNVDYSGFENENRTNPDILKDKQSMYLKYFLNKNNVVDIGCGRGEFLKLLLENNISCKGIDLSDDFVQQCQTDGLDVKNEDALTFLENQADNSLGGLIALQVVEHLQPGYLIEFIKIAYQKLQPGAYIILETVNPQSLIVFSSSFYKDLSHIKPIHPAILQFLMKSMKFNDCIIEYSGFVEETQKLQKILTTTDIDSNKLYNDNIEKLNNLIFGAQDYAAVGKK